MRLINALRVSDRSNFQPESRPDILPMISLDDDFPKRVISACIAVTRNLRIRAMTNNTTSCDRHIPCSARESARRYRRAKVHDGFFFLPSLPFAAASRFCAAFLSRGYFQFPPLRIRAIVFTRLEIAYAALRRARSV